MFLTLIFWSGQGTSMLCVSAEAAWKVRLAWLGHVPVLGHWWRGTGTLRSGLMKTQYRKIYSLSVRSFMTNASRRLATKDPVKKPCTLTRILLPPVNNSWFSVSLSLAYYCYIQYCYHYSNWLWFYKWLLGRDINNIVISSTLTKSTAVFTFCSCIPLGCQSFHTEWIFYMHGLILLIWWEKLIWIPPEWNQSLFILADYR